MALVEPTRRESGCIQYELLQNQEDPTDFVFVEEWESEVRLNAHLDSPHINGVGALIGWIVSGESSAQGAGLPQSTATGETALKEGFPP